MDKKSLSLLNQKTIVEVVKLNEFGEFVQMLDMEYGKWLNFKGQKGFAYISFQKGFSQFKKKLI
jgi:hypothetical protein